MGGRTGVESCAETRWESWQEDKEHQWLGFGEHGVSWCYIQPHQCQRPPRDLGGLQNLSTTEDNQTFLKYHGHCSKGKEWKWEGKKKKQPNYWWWKDLGASSKVAAVCCSSALCRWQLDLQLYGHCILDFLTTPWSERVSEASKKMVKLQTIIKSIHMTLQV